MTDRSDMAGNNISNVYNPISNQDAAKKSYVDTLGALKLAKAGDAMSEALSMGSDKITDVGNPTRCAYKILHRTAGNSKICSN